MNYTVICILAIAVTQCTFAGEEGIAFQETKFFHRWAKENQHEFTPEGQEDLARWTAMITVNLFPTVKTGEDLATAANNLLELYEQVGGIVLRTVSKPKTADKEADHFIAVALPQKGFMEIAFARLVIAGGDACSIVYSHRITGEDGGEKAGTWLQEHAMDYEDTLMKLNVPEALSLAKASRKQP
jgi:hypothetical protein